MFFDVVLLNRQHKCKFGIAWIAGTRGINYLSKKEIEDLNIAELCENLIEFVTSKSTIPRNRFSLRLSANLLYGAVKLQRKKAALLQDFLFKQMQIITIPTVVFESTPQMDEQGMFNTPSTPETKPKKPRKTSKVLKETPDEELIVPHVLLEKSPLVEDPNRITLVDDKLLITERDPLQVEDIFAIGDGTEFEKIMQQMPISEISAPIEGILHPNLESSLDEPPKVITVQVQIHQSAEGSISLVAEKEKPSKIIPEKHSEVEISHLVPVEEQVAFEKKLPETQIQIDDIFTLPHIPPKPRKKKPEIPSELFLRTEKRFKYQLINRKVEISAMQDEVPLETVSCMPLSASSLIEEFWPTSGFPDVSEKHPSILRATGSSISTDLSIGPRRSSDHRTPSTGRRPKHLSVEASEFLLEPTMASTPVTSKQPEDIAKATSQIKKPKLLADVQEQEILLTAEDLGAIIDKTREEEQIVTEGPEIRDKIYDIRTTTQLRQQNIIKIVTTWDNDREITIQDIADKPLTKLHMARAFNDSLSLCKAGYIELITHEDSLEVKCIRKGRKFNNM